MALEDGGGCVSQLIKTYTEGDCGANDTDRYCGTSDERSLMRHDPSLNLRLRLWTDALLHPCVTQQHLLLWPLFFVSFVIVVFLLLLSSSFCLLVLRLMFNQGCQCTWSFQAQESTISAPQSPLVFTDDSICKPGLSQYFLSYSTQLKSSISSPLFPSWVCGLSIQPIWTLQESKHQLFQWDTAKQVVKEKLKTLPAR